MKFRITSAVSGADLGVYDGETHAEALDAMARDAGYHDAAEARRTSGDDGGHLKVTPVPNDEPSS